jgi:hypothetical protein
VTGELAENDEYKVPKMLALFSRYKSKAYRNYRMVESIRPSDGNIAPGLFFRPTDE